MFARAPDPNTEARTPVPLAQHPGDIRARGEPGAERGPHHVGLDGLSLALVLMTTVVFAACAVYALGDEQRPRLQRVYAAQRSVFLCIMFPFPFFFFFFFSFFFFLGGGGGARTNPVQRSSPARTER